MIWYGHVMVMAMTLYTHIYFKFIQSWRLGGQSRAPVAVKQVFCQSPSCVKIKRSQCIHHKASIVTNVKVVWCRGDRLKPQNLNLLLRTTNHFYLRANLCIILSRPQEAIPFISALDTIVPPAGDQTDLCHTLRSNCSVALATTSATLSLWSLVEKATLYSVMNYSMVFAWHAWCFLDCGTYCLACHHLL